tara:strand:+ start:733 stop:1065 length:333 start_codon:yes stop_codon:yes gene_type:complete
MADKLHGFTVQEAQNFNAYDSYKYQKITMDTSAKPYADWSTDPAKHIVVYGVGTADDTDTSIELYLSGGADYSTAIELNSADLPLIITGLLIDRVRITGTNDVIGVLSFH